MPVHTWNAELPLPGVGWAPHRLGRCRSNSVLFRPVNASASQPHASSRVEPDPEAVADSSVDRTGESAAAEDPLTDDDFHALVSEHSAAVFRLARSVVRDASLADDVTQETFIKVWKHFDEFRGDGSRRGWILRIAHNQAVSTLRRIKDTATDPERLPDRTGEIGTARVVEGRAGVEALRSALDELDELTREIVVLREVEGMSYDEIAETLEVPIPTVKTRLLRGRRRLSVLLADWRSEPVAAGPQPASGSVSVGRREARS